MKQKSVLSIYVLLYSYIFHKCQEERPQQVRNIVTLTPSVESVVSLTSISKRRSAHHSEEELEREDIVGPPRPSVETLPEPEE